MDRGIPVAPSKSVFITRTIPDRGVAALIDAGLRVTVNPLPRTLRHDELVRDVGRHDAVICQFMDRVDAAVLDAAHPRCRVFSNCAVGYDNIDLAAARARAIAVTTTPDVLTEATADLTWGLLLAAARRLGEAERYVRAGVWRGWGMLDFLGADVYGRTLGIVGAGRIGTAVARRAHGFSMRVVYHARSEKPAMQAMGAERLPLSRLLEQSDFVSVHTPLTPETQRLIDARAIGHMKNTAVLINTSRGSVVDEQALIEALRSGRIAAAGLDVYQNEPHVPAELMALENVALLPHIGSATEETRARMAGLAAENVVAILAGKRPPHAVVLPGQDEK